MNFDKIAAKFIYYGYKTGKCACLAYLDNIYTIYKIDFACQVFHNEIITITQFEGDIVEKNLDIFIRRLIELDSKAVELKGEKDTALLELEMKRRNELRSIDAALSEAASAAKRRHDEIIEAAKRQAREIDEAATQKADMLHTAFNSFKEAAAMDIWKQLLDVER